MVRSLWLAALVAAAGCPSESEEGDDSGTDTATMTAGMSMTMTTASTSSTTADPTTSGSDASSSDGGTSSDSGSTTGSSGSSSSGEPLECEWFEQPNAGRDWGLCGPAAWWENAEDHCVAEGGHLVSITGQPDSIFAINVLGATAEAWIGFNDLEREGTWVWTDGSDATYDNWEDKQPDNPEDHCAAIGTTRRWFDYNCNESRPFICARPN